MQAERVYVAEYGHGARSGTVLERNGDRVRVQLDDQDCPRTCYASSVYPTREAAEEASR